MATLIEATNEINGRFKAAWDYAHSVAGVPGPLPAVYRMSDGDNKPRGAEGQIWARMGHTYDSGFPTSISRARVENRGRAIVEIFVPSAKTSAEATAMKLAQYVQAAFIEHVGEVTFTEVRFDPQDPEGVWRKLNVVAAFYWASIRGK